MINKLNNELPLKDDKDKNRLGLVVEGFANTLWEVGLNGTFGVNKYFENSWKLLERSRYMDAGFRHLFLFLKGEIYDEETGICHLTMAIWNFCAFRELMILEERVNESK